jgi:hypothetical protein
MANVVKDYRPIGNEQQAKQLRQMAIGNLPQTVN